MTSLALVYKSHSNKALNRILEFLEEFCWNMLEKILKNPLCISTEEYLYLIELMSYLEAVVEVLGDDLGISDDLGI
jgi:hypothetical protein